MFDVEIIRKFITYGKDGAQQKLRQKPKGLFEIKAIF